MVHDKTISRIIFEGLGELFILTSAVLIALIVTSGLSVCFLVLVAFLIGMGVIFRIFAEELLGDIVSGKIFERLSRFNITSKNK